MVGQCSTAILSNFFFFLINTKAVHGFFLLSQIFGIIVLFWSETYIFLILTYSLYFSAFYLISFYNFYVINLFPLTQSNRHDVELRAEMLDVLVSGGGRGLPSFLSSGVKTSVLRAVSEALAYATITCKDSN